MMDYPRAEYPINIRFLAQGMLKVPKIDVPEGLKEWPPEKVWEWAQEYLGKVTRDGLIAALAYLDVEEDSVADAVEANDEEDYPILVQSKAWDAFWRPDAREMQSIAKPT